MENAFAPHETWIQHSKNNGMKFIPFWYTVFGMKFIPFFFWYEIHTIFGMPGVKSEIISILV